MSVGNGADIGRDAEGQRGIDQGQNSEKAEASGHAGSTEGQDLGFLEWIKA